jgi:hypothetical protein
MKGTYYYIAAAASTALAGLVHLYLVGNSLSHHRFGNPTILFLVGGIAQVFWVIPILKQWGKIWYSIGIAGTAAFIAIWAITRMSGNPITGKGGDVAIDDIICEAAQIAFIGFTAVILMIENRRHSMKSAATEMTRQ